MDLRMVLAHPDLDLVVRVPPPEGPQPVRAVYTTDLLDPSRYLCGGELVLTGLVWWRAPGDAEPFVAALARAGVTALAAGAVEHGGVPDDLVLACARHGVPLVEVPSHVSFAAVTEVVVLGVAAASDLGSAVASARSLGVECRVLTATGRVIEGDPDVPGRELARRFLTAPRLPATGEDTLLPVSSAPRAMDWFVAVRGCDWTARHRRAVDAVVSAAAAEKAVRDSVPRSDSVPPSATALVSASLDGAPATALLAELAATLGAVGPPAEVGSETFAVVDLAGGDVRAELPALARLVGPGLDGARLALGLGTGSSAAEAAAQAREARRVAERGSDQVCFVDGRDLAAFQSLLVAVPDAERTAFRDRVLGPLLAYDAEHNSGLVATLRAFLSCDRSWTRAAEALHVHVNTLRYRIGRIEALTGKPLSETTSVVDFHLALHLLPEHL